MQAEGVVAGGSVAGVMETPPTPAATDTMPLTPRATSPDFYISSYLLLLLLCLKNTDRFCNE